MSNRTLNNEQRISFRASVLGYLVNRINKLPIKWGWVGVGIAGMILITSIVTTKTGTAGFTTWKEVIQKAARLGDYTLARKLWEEQENKNKEYRILGAESELENLVYPEKRIEKEIAKYEELNTKYPESRDILLTLSSLYKEYGNVEKANAHYEMARVLDPNNEIFK